MVHDYDDELENNLIYYNKRLENLRELLDNRRELNLPEPDGTDVKVGVPFLFDKMYSLKNADFGDKGKMRIKITLMVLYLKVTPPNGENTKYAPESTGFYNQQTEQIGDKEKIKAATLAFLKEKLPEDSTPKIVKLDKHYRRCCQGSEVKDCSS